MRVAGTSLRIAAFVILLASCGGGKPSQQASETPSKAGTASTQNCVGITADDAAPFLGAPAAQITANVEESYKNFWLCSFAQPGGSTSVSFSVKIAGSDKEAAGDMEEYRNNLELAGQQPQWKNLPKGAYSDILGLADEAVWTDINGSLTVRKGKVTLQIVKPAGKMEQIKVAEAFLKKLQP
jgi:hypothetical protein